ncbi:MAG: type II toxin-antitoxin system YoeB family toxin [Dorea sp.]|nr:type II toxin-antitoxin system YoeB family toxin [Dorea sp.]
MKWREPVKGGWKTGAAEREPERIQEQRVDEANRIVYFEENGIVYIISCRGHYDDN